MCIRDRFKKAGGVRADFTLKAVNDGHLEGRENGIIQLKGEKFMPVSYTHLDVYKRQYQSKQDADHQCIRRKDKPDVRPFTAH